MIRTLWCLLVLTNLHLLSPASAQPPQHVNLEIGSIRLPQSFPQSDYTPHGYIDNPYHSTVMNRSGLIRSVPPMGFGYWTRELPWPYGEEAIRTLNYLSLLHLSLHIDGIPLHTLEDLEASNVSLVSRYHTKTMMSYDGAVRNIQFSAKYFLPSEHTLACLFSARNSASTAKEITVHATNLYGWPATQWWGYDGFAASYNAEADVGVSKIWAYGDVFVIGADRPSGAHKSTGDRDEWTRWIAANDRSSNSGGKIAKPGPVHALQTYQLQIPAGESRELLICLTRGVSETSAIAGHQNAVATARATLREQLDQDQRFYEQMPHLVGDWPASWKHGWIYDWETLRMTIRPAVGIFKHPWDGMQVFLPRRVLGESMIDAMCLSYADMDLAKQVILGTFTDSPAPNIPCCREDGSVNMICSNGLECGTAPIWGFPFHVIHSVYLRDGDHLWIAELYPHLKVFAEWWLENRTDEDGWFYTACDLESGQDGSRRFELAGVDREVAARLVRAVDIEAAMVHAFQSLAVFAEIAGNAQDAYHWHDMADDRIARVHSMFVDGGFRDFDSRTAKPIMIPDYHSAMTMTPLTLGLATPEQMESVRPQLHWFKDHPTFWLEWPAFMFTFVEAAWNAGERPVVAEVVAETCDRIYPRLDKRRVRWLTRNEVRQINPSHYAFPEQYLYRIPGVSHEFWPREDDHLSGCENYGWGATLPFHVIRNVIGFREITDSQEDRFILAPAIPSHMARPGSSYGITNLRFRGTASDLRYYCGTEQKLRIELVSRSAKSRRVTVLDQRNHPLAEATSNSAGAKLEFSGTNGQCYTVILDGNRRPSANHR